MLFYYLCLHQIVLLYNTNLIYQFHQFLLPLLLLLPNDKFQHYCYYDVYLYGHLCYYGNYQPDLRHNFYVRHDDIPHFHGLNL